ncbi:glycogen synthase GlgA [Pseudoruegeria sp. SK021]|uniref:glycogen synthase GlgA n=1 Tax=Pseudoruegeria sp. SK021 TaxID=1933035 RepID=UPI000A23DD1A|nr:glycogen synthase GlgA [Pseudoruegeria sp. SK021]OSP53753.1 starch synthase [Pseudoruegeria sp. SK021]
MTTVLSVASECAPLVKTGGLADVVGALPSAVAAQGVTMKTLLPGYPAVMDTVTLGEVVLSESDLFGGYARVLEATGAGLSLYILDAPHLFARSGSIYLGDDGQDWPDNPARFAALCWMAARIGAEGAAGWVPDVLHCHDWQAGLTPVYLREMGAADRVGTLLTVHNIAFHGMAPALMLPRLRLPDWSFHPGGLEFYGRISALKAGLVYCDKLSTVSPTYARELLTPEFGMGMDGVLRSRRADLSGILNGIDETAWDPATDPEITPYASAGEKTVNTDRLAREFGLPDGPGPLAVVISRMTAQKGLDLLLDALPGFLARGGRLAVLGSGDPELERAYHAAAAHPQVAVRIGYDEALSHRMIAGGDAILVPSRFEPCGLTQLYGLRYGTIPVVAFTGGLADSIVPASDAGLKAGVATGLQVHPITADTLSDVLIQLCDLYADPPLWATLQRNAMRHPVGWSASAAGYADLYRALTHQE